LSVNIFETVHRSVAGFIV